MVSIDICKFNQLEHLGAFKFSDAIFTYEAAQFYEDLRILTDFYNDYEREQKRRHDLYIQGRVCMFIDRTWERFIKFYELINNRTHRKLDRYLMVLWQHNNNL